MDDLSNLKSGLWSIAKEIAKEHNSGDLNKVRNCYRMLVKKMTEMIDEAGEVECYQVDYEALKGEFCPYAEEFYAEEFGHREGHRIRPMVNYANSLMSSFVEGVNSVKVKDKRMRYIDRREIFLSVRFDYDVKSMTRNELMVLSAMWSVMDDADDAVQKVSLVDVCETLFQRKIRKSQKAGASMSGMLADVKQLVCGLMCKYGMMSGRVRMRLPGEDRDDMFFGGQLPPLLIDADREFMEACARGSLAVPDFVSCRLPLMKTISDRMGWRWRVPSEVFCYDKGTGGFRTWMLHLFLASLVLSKKSRGCVSRHTLNQFGSISGKQLACYMEVLKKAGMVDSFVVDRKGVSWNRK